MSDPHAPVGAADDFSEYARKLVSYSEQYHEARPAASPLECIEMGTGKLVGEYGHGKAHLGQIALSELAAKLVFGGSHGRS